MSAPRTYGTIERQDDAWVVTAIEPHVALRLKAIFPRIQKTARPPFRLVGGASIDADLKWFMARYPLVISDDVRVRMAEQTTLFEMSQAELGAILARDWKPSAAVAFREGMRPYGYQAQAAELCRRTGRLLLMDDLGLGKTVSALATIVHQECLPALVVPQTHLVRQWVEKVAEFTHLTTHVVRQGSPYALPKADVYICPYSKLAGWVDYAGTAPFKAVVFDEMQELRNGRGTAKGRAAWAFRRGAELALGLTATPIYNYGDEIYRIITLLEQDALGSWSDFATEWCTPIGGGKWKVKDPPALGTFLRESHLALRRTSDEVGHEMPPLDVITHEVPFDERVLADEAELMRDLALKVTAGAFVERGQAAREFDLKIRHATGVAKAPHVAAFVKILLASGEPVLLCGWHRDVYDIWLERLAAHRPLLFTGSETPAQKERTKTAFCAGESNLMIMSLRSGAGLDGLQHRCATIVFGELDWSPQVHAQCCGRLRRPGQARQVSAIYLHADGGSDPGVISVLGLKASQARGIIDPLAAAPDQHSDGARIKALAEAYLAGNAQAARPVELARLAAGGLGMAEQMGLGL